MILVSQMACLDPVEDALGAWGRSVTGQCRWCRMRSRTVGSWFRRSDSWISIDQLIVWFVIGAIAGSLAGLIVKRTKEGYGRFGNLGVGLVGAVVGGLLFRLLRIDLGLGAISVSLEDIVAALVGSILFLIALRLLRKRG